METTNYRNFPRWWVYKINFLAILYPFEREKGVQGKMSPVLGLKSNVFGSHKRISCCVCLDLLGSRASNLFSLARNL